MSWDIFKQNVLRVMRNPESINDIDLVAKTFAIEYDSAIRRGSDTINGVSIKTGNIQLMEQLFKAALQKGLTSSQPYDLVGEMGNGVLGYWTGATLNEFPFPIIPAVGSTQNVGVVSNIVTNTGVWAPAITLPNIPEITDEIPIEQLLKEIPDNNNTLEGIETAITETGIEFINDDGGELDSELSQLKQSLKPDNPPFEQSEEGEKLDTIEDNGIESQPIQCGSGVDYNAKISSNYKLRNLSLDCTFPHKIKAQRGLSERDIVCNLQNVAINLLEPIRGKYPNLIINSAFRGNPSLKGSVSQHEKGEAIDLQFKGLSPKDYLEVSDWIIKNVAFDQFIFEHGNSIWLHISCSRTKKQRKQLLTMYKGKYESGIKLYYK
jgi:hypothetical protein